MRRSPIKVTQLVKQMGISRGTYYNHIADPKLPLELLEQYGKVLRYDFTQDIPQMKKYSLEEPEAYYGQPATLEEAIRQRDYYREKYYTLMEQYHKVVEKHLDLDV